MNELVVKGVRIKDVLGLFRNEEELKIVALGDTFHPADGFVDETLFKDVKTIGGFLMINYEFDGLVIFDAKTRRVEIHYDNDKDEFALTGDIEDLREIEPKLNLLK